MSLTIVKFRCRTDNLAVLIHDDDSGATAAVDAPDGEAIAAELQARGWGLDLLLITHHHDDHTAGNAALKAAFGCTIVGPKAEADRIPAIDGTVADGDSVAIAGRPASVLAVPGHTLGHVAYVLPAADAAFVGDTLFAMGCGRIFEGTAEQMWGSLQRLRALPDETRLYCGHDYAAANARFALTVDPDNAALQARAAEVAALAGDGHLPQPSIGLEKRTNPFLRVETPAVRAALGMADAAPAAVFAALRRRKDGFG